MHGGGGWARPKTTPGSPPCAHTLFTHNSFCHLVVKFSLARPFTVSTLGVWLACGMRHEHEGGVGWKPLSLRSRVLQGTHTAQPNGAHEGVANSASWMVHGGRALEASPSGSLLTNAPHSCGYGLIPRLTMLRTAHSNTNLSVPCPAFGVTCTAQFPRYNLPRGGGCCVYSSGTAGHQAGRCG